MFLRDVIANKCTGTEILFLHDFMVVEQCADRRELIILCLEHEFEILNVQGIAFLPDFGNGILNRDLQIFDIPILYHWRFSRATFAQPPTMILSVDVVSWEFRIFALRS